MPDLSTVILLVSFAYTAAAIGLAAALGGWMWTRRGGRLPCVGEAAWCAFLPPVAVLLLPLSALHPHPSAALARMHEWWHGFEQAIHATPVAHGSLHVANALLLLVTGIGIVRAVYASARIRAFGTTICAAATPEPVSVDGIPLYSIASPRLVCFTMGVVRPAIYLSTSLQSNLTPQDRRAILAHEAAHIRRRDGAVRMFLFLFYALFPLPGSHRLLIEWQQAAERACDAEAAVRIGSAPDVAAALIRVVQATTLGSSPMPVGAGFVAFDDDIEGRVQALLDIATSRSRNPPTRLVLCGIGYLLAASVWIDHLVDLFVHH